MSKWADDDALMQDLVDALHEQKVPERLRDAAEAVFSWRTLDADLLSLEHDSLLVDGLAVRGPESTAHRTVSFQGGGINLEIELTDGNLLGQIVPGRVCRITLIPVNGEQRTADVDAAGFFFFTDVQPGPVRFQVELERPTHTTSWLEL